GAGSRGATRVAPAASPALRPPAARAGAALRSAPGGARGRLGPPLPMPDAGEPDPRHAAALVQPGRRIEVVRGDIQLPPVVGSKALVVGSRGFGGTSGDGVPWGGRLRRRMRRRGEGTARPWRRA